MRDKRMVVAGIISGIICAVAVFAYIQTVTAEADQERTEALERYGGEQVEVCVATRDILPGETIDATNTETKLWLADLLPEEPIESIEDVAGQSVASTIAAGEVVTALRFEQGSASIDVPEGMVAVSLPAEEVKAVGGAIAAGMSVDVYLTGSSGTTLLGQQVLVLATSAESSTDSTSGTTTWVTVAVEPEAVEEFVSSAEAGNLYFALPGDAVAADGDASDDDDDADADGGADEEDASADDAGAAESGDGQAAEGEESENA